MQENNVPSSSNSEQSPLRRTACTPESQIEQEGDLFIENILIRFEFNKERPLGEQYSAVVVGGKLSGLREVGFDISCCIQSIASKVQYFSVKEHRNNSGTTISDAFKALGELMPNAVNCKCVCEYLLRDKCELNCPEHSDNQGENPELSVATDEPKRQERILEVCYRKPDGSVVVNYRRPEFSEDAQELIKEVHEMIDKQGDRCRYFYRYQGTEPSEAGTERSNEAQSETPAPTTKETQKQHLSDIIKKDEEIGLYDTPELSGEGDVYRCVKASELKDLKQIRYWLRHIDLQIPLFGELYWDGKFHTPCGEYAPEEVEVLMPVSLPAPVVQVDVEQLAKREAGRLHDIYTKRDKFTNPAYYSGAYDGVIAAAQYLSKQSAPQADIEKLEPFIQKWKWQYRSGDPNRIDVSRELRADLESLLSTSKQSAPLQDVEELAVAILEWILKEAILPRDTTWFDVGKHYTSKELFTLYAQSLQHRGKDQVAGASGSD